MALAVPGGLKRGRGRLPKVKLPEQTSVNTDDPASLSGDRLLGRPVEYFSAEERLYAEERISDLQRANGNDKRAIRIIEAAVMLDIEVQRCEDKLARLERMPTSKDTLDQISILHQQRSRAMKEHIERLGDLGALPRDLKSAKGPREETMAQCHRDYLAELDRRRKANHPIGQISQAAKELAQRENLNPDEYCSKRVLHDLERKELLSKSDLEAVTNVIDATEGVLPKEEEPLHQVP